jgi:hypothetical protein
VAGGTVLPAAADVLSPEADAGQVAPEVVAAGPESGRARPVFPAGARVA